MIDNIAAVVTYADDDQTIPADYVLKWAHDFEAFVAKFTKASETPDGIDTLDAISIGRFASVTLAINAIVRWNELDMLGRRNADGWLDFNPPRGH